MPDFYVGISLGLLSQRLSHCKTDISLNSFGGSLVLLQTFVVLIPPLKSHQTRMRSLLGSTSNFLVTQRLFSLQFQCQIQGLSITLEVNRLAKVVLTQQDVLLVP